MARRPRTKMKIPIYQGPYRSFPQQRGCVSPAGGPSAPERGLPRDIPKTDARGSRLTDMEPLGLPLIPPNPTGKEGHTIPE